MAYTTIDDPSAYFQVTTYTGAGANTVVTNGGNSDLKPDLLWIKNRGAAYAHFLVDSNRGISYAQNSSNAPYLEPNSTAVENNNQNWMSSVNTDGFTTGISEHINSNSGSSFVAWQWKANGGTTVNNTDGDLTTVVQANTTAGFSIITYTGKDPIEPLDLGHGLGKVPEFWFIKSRQIGAKQWGVYHKNMNATPQNYYLTMHTGNAAIAASTWWRNEAPTTTVIKTGEQDDVNRANSNYVCYAWTSIQGFSKFGKYVGNASADGPFIYTGFQPAWVMIKTISTTDDWYIFDNEREGYNPSVWRIRANTTGGDTTGTNNTVDHLSNGFKLRFTGGSINGSGLTYIYMAFAETSIHNINRSANNGTITKKSANNSTKTGEIICGHYSIVITQ